MRYLILGNKGQLGSHFERVFKEKGYNFVGLDKEELDITNRDAVDLKIGEIKPEIVINCAAYNLVEDAEKDATLAFEINEKGVRNIAEACKKRNCFLVHYGTNTIFDGTKGLPYTEEDIPNPINEYGKSKLAGEKALQEILNDNFLILRTSWLYGEGTQNLIYKFLNRVKEGKELMGTIDDIATPTSTKTLVNLTLLSLDKNLKGIYHAVNSGTASRWDWLSEILKITGKNLEIKKVEVASFNLVARVPVDSTLCNLKISKELGIDIPDWKEELATFLSEQTFFDINF